MEIKLQLPNEDTPGILLFLRQLIASLPIRQSRFCISHSSCHPGRNEVTDRISPGFYRYAVSSTAPLQNDSVAQTLEQIPEVSYLVLILGAYDLVIEVYCRDRDHLTDIIINQIQSISGIQSTETLVIGKIFKLSFSWQPQINPQAK